MAALIGRVVREDDTKYMVQTQSRANPDASVGGIITTSTLVIMNLEGCDSGVVQCVAETQYVS